MTLHNFDILFLSKTHLDSSTPSDDDSLEISGYNLIPLDHSSNNKRGGTRIFEFVITALRRILSQTEDDFLSFNLFVLVTIANFNAKLRHCYRQDTNNFD